MKQLITKNYKWIIIILCIISFALLIEYVLIRNAEALDRLGYSLVEKHLISDTITPIAKLITNFANAYWLVILTAVLIIVIKNKRIGIAIFINLGLSGIINFILKNILQRPRPEGYRLIDESGYSFPSGHSMVSLAFYGFLIYLVYRFIKNKYIKVTLIAILTILIICIGISRIYLGVHYTSDVLAGFLVSMAYLIVFIHFAKKKI